MIQGAGVALLWLLGSAAALVAGLSLPPVHVRARVAPFRFDEGTLGDWKAVPFEVDLGALFGALRLHFERGNGGLRVGWSFFGIARPVRAEGRRRAVHPPGELARHSRQENRSALGPGEERWRRSKARHKAPAATGGAGRRRKRAFHLEDLRRLLPEVGWLLAQARRRMKFEVRGVLVYGFSDPFATAAAHLATTTLPPLPEFRLQPDYSQGTLRGRVELSLRAYPWQVALLLLRACLRPNVRDLWWPRVRSALWLKPLRLKPKKTKEVVTS